MLFVARVNWKTSYIFVKFQDSYKYLLMGAEESKLLQRKPSKSKITPGDKSSISQDVSDFITQLSTLACIRTTNESTFQYVAFNKLPFTGHYAPLPLCSTISNNYSSVFICYDCSTDDHAYLCQSCFEKGNHDAHRFSVFPNNDGWRLLFCRCGDEEFMKKKTLCETHVEIPKVAAEPIDKKDIPKFSAYFNQTFRVLFSLMQKNRAGPLLNSVFSYLDKLTNGNLYFSKIVCQFLLQKNVIDNQSSNLKKFVTLGGLNNSRWYCVIRNLNFASEYKIPFLKEMISGINQGQSRLSVELFELVLNFAGNVSYLNSLAKDQNIYVCKSGSYQFYQLLIKTKADVTDIWRCLVKNKKVADFVNNANIIKNLITNLINDSEAISSILSQVLQLKNENHEDYIITCFMILNPQFFIPSQSQSQPLKKVKTSTKSNIPVTPPQNLQKQLYEYYQKMFFDLNTHSQSQQMSSTMMLLLPFFSFGEELVNKFWNQMERRVEVITKNKEKKVIKEASMNLFGIITCLLEDFMIWDHKVLRDASAMNLKSYTKDAKLVEKVLVEYFDKKPKNFRQELLSNVDIYTQKQRSLAKNAMKIHLRYNAKKGKYYTISKKLPNNTYNFQQLNIGAPLKFTQWQQFVNKKFFTEAFYRLVPNLIKIAQKALMEDIQMVKTVSNISVSICLLNKSKKQNIKEVTRNFIKEIPDVREDIYYVLAKIRDRLQLDIDDIEESGKQGTKRPKLDLITEIRDKKFREIKQRQERLRKKWLKQAEALESDHDDDAQQNICNICKEKDSDKRRFVYPCNFTRNNVISTLLNSDVTDLDINICLHKVHEDCFQKQKRKGECPVCKFEINCYIPEKPLADESYTKNWLRNFENIITSINMQSGKSFNSDWATIFLTYLIYSRSFKVLLKSSEIQLKQREKTDELLVSHYKSQLEKWPELTKQAIKRAEKTVKGQVSRQSTIKKIVKSLTSELMLQEITEQPVKNVKRVEKKFRELINAVGTENAEKINQCFAWSKDHESIQEVFTSNIADEVDELFKIRELPEKVSDYLSKTSIKCPMCNKYQPTTWQCLFCSKISCQMCMSPNNHCFSNHKGSGIILHLSNAQYEFYHENRQVERDSLYRNQYEEGWTRSENTDGWVAHTEEIYKFFDTILHSHSPFKKQNTREENSDNEGEVANRGWGGNRNRLEDEDDDRIQEEEHEDAEEHDEEEQAGEEQPEQREEQEEEHQEEEEEEEEEQEERAPRRKAKKPARSTPAKAATPAKRR